MSLNKVIIMGRITHELEIKQTTGGTAVLQFTVALDRYSKSEEKQADFISCVAWRQTAEFIAKYFGKGRMIAVTGTLHSRTYEDKNGSKHYVTEVYVDSADFTGEPKASQTAQGAPYSAAVPQGYNNTPAQSEAPQSAPQAAQQTNNGYPSLHMYAPPNDVSYENEYKDFEVFNDDGVPF